MRAKEEKKKESKGKKTSKAAAKKEETSDAPEDDTEAGTAATAFNGADEDEVIDKIFGQYSKESFNAAGQPSGEKVVFKEDAQKAGKEIIETLKGVKGKKLNTYMK